jgi:hypothetical protein
MKVEPKPIKISPEVAAKCDGPNQLAKFDDLVSRLLAVPREKFLERKEDYAFHSANNDSRRGPKRKRKLVSPAPAVEPRV